MISNSVKQFLCWLVIAKLLVFFFAEASCRRRSAAGGTLNAGNHHFRTSLLGFDLMSFHSILFGSLECTPGVWGGGGEWGVGVLVRPQVNKFE